MLDSPVFFRPIDHVGIFWAVGLSVSVVPCSTANRADEFAQLRADDFLSLWIFERVTEEIENRKGNERWTSYIRFEVLIYTLDQLFLLTRLQSCRTRELHSE